MDHQMTTTIQSQEAVNNGGESNTSEAAYQQSYYDYAAYYAYWQQQYPEAYSKYVAQCQEWQQQQMVAYPSNYGYPYGQEDSGYGREHKIYSRDRSNPSPTLWVGNLPYDCSESDLRMAFNRFGPIKTINYLPSRCCAFVTFHDLESSTSAMQQSQSIAVKGTYVRINWRKTSNESVRREEVHNNATNNLWVGMLDSSTTEDDLRKAFQPFGQIENIKFVPSRNYAFVAYSKVEHAVRALEERNGYHLCGSNIKVNFGKHEQSQQPHASPADHARSSLGLREGAEFGGPIVVPTDRNKTIIDTLASKFQQIGPRRSAELEQILRYHKANTPDFNFLRGGEYHNYYLWKCSNPDIEYSDDQVKIERPPWAIDDQDEQSATGSNNERDQQFSDAMPIPPWKQDEPSTDENLSEHEKHELMQILHNTQPKQDQIQRAAAWILHCGESKSAEIIQIILDQISQRQTFAEKTPLFFIVHQCLQACTRPDYSGSSSQILDSFATFLPEICSGIYQVASTDEKKQVLSWIESWNVKKIFSPEFVSSIVKSITNSHSPHTADGSSNNFSDDPSFLQSFQHDR